MLSKELPQDKVVFVNPFKQISIKPIILGAILASLMIAFVADRKVEIQSNIMFSAVKCGEVITVGGFTFLKTRGYYQDYCPGDYVEI